MKKLASLLLLILACVASALAQTNPTVTLTWTGNDTNATDYQVFEISGNSLEQIGTATGTNVYSLTLTPGYHYYAVAAVNTTNVSAPSIPLKVLMLRRPSTKRGNNLILDYRQHVFTAPLFSPGTNYLQFNPSTNAYTAPSGLYLTTP